MKAVLLKPKAEGRPAVEVVEMDIPKIMRGEVLVNMAACGLCGTDIEKIHGRYTAAMPVLGHEAVGMVSEVGDGVREIKKGDRVFPHHHVSCGECYYCRRGSATMCAEYRRSNLDPGGFAEYFRVPKENVDAGGVLKVPENVSFELAALTEPLACCLRALDRVGAGRDDTVLVVGAGPVGMMHSLLLGSMKAKVLVSDISAGRLKSAEAMGGGVILDASKADIPAQVRELTEQRGADAVIVASGSPRAIVQGMKSVRKGGKVCIFGVPGKGSALDYDFSELFNSEVDVLTNYGATERDTTRALELIAGKSIDFGRLVTDRFPLERFNEALDAASEGTALKILITP